MNAKEFESIVGHPPEHDDLDRANCPLAGKEQHYMCGICPSCGQPRFVCGNPSQLPGFREDEPPSDELPN
jgi:hypothetical protein